MHALSRAPRARVHADDYVHAHAVVRVRASSATNAAPHICWRIASARYEWELKRLYDGSNKAWLTPVEIFSPWCALANWRWPIGAGRSALTDVRYGCAVGRHVASVFESGAYGDEAESLHVVEVGGGNGTVRLCVCARTCARVSFKGSQIVCVRLSVCARPHGLDAASSAERVRTAALHTRRDFNRAYRPLEALRIKGAGSQKVRKGA
jgi:hypothetical protein